MRLRLLRSASIVALLLAQTSAQADGVLPAAATPVQREQAQARFLRGKDLMTRRQYEDALAEFRASHEIVASPNTRLETARCLLAMGRLIAAYAELGRAAVEAKELTSQDHRYQRAYDAATAERGEIEPKLAFVSLTIDNPSDGTQVTVGGEEIRRAAWSEPAPVQAGATDIAVLTPGRKPITRSITVAAQERTSLRIDAQAAPLDLSESTAPPPAASASAPPPRSLGGAWMRPGAYVAGGVGAAGLVAFGVFGLMARSTYDDLNRTCGGGACPSDRADEISSGKTNQTIANVALAVGIVGAAAGVTLFVLSTSHGSSSAALAVSPGWIGVRGSL
jgi:hypothetical protein